MKPNHQTAAICGLFCVSCPSYPDLCHGCLSDKLTTYCLVCPAGFRACAKAHAVKRCYECAEFPCERLEKFSKEHCKNGTADHRDIIDNLSGMKEQGLLEWLEQKIAKHARSSG